MTEDSKKKKANASEVIGEGMLLGGRIIGMLLFGFLTLVFVVVGIACFYYAANYSKYLEDMDRSRKECLDRKESGHSEPAEICDSSSMSKGGLVAVGIVGSLLASFSGYMVFKVYSSDRVASLFGVSWLLGSLSR